MAKYSDEIDSAYEDIAEAGGAIKFTRRPPNSVGNAPVAPLPDGSYPWEGNDDEAAKFDHVAVFVPFSTISVAQLNPFSEACLIPAKNLPFPLAKGTVFENASGDLYQIENLIALRPDGVSLILYTCEVTLWAQP